MATAKSPSAPRRAPYNGPRMGIGSVLIDRGLVTKAQLDQAVAEQRASGERLDRVLIRMGVVIR